MPLLPIKGHNLSAEQQSSTSRILIPILLTGLSGLPPLSIDMFLPSMPAMVEEFQTHPTHIQPAVTFFLIALGAAQLVFGPLSDRFGRRPILLIGLACYALAGLGCLFAPTVGALILA
ncbi:MAG: MFS transporter, partial [Gemmatimonadota bacterium]|nr:MFS transporter [Gemmatimonadota bacterium]